MVLHYAKGSCDSISSYVAEMNMDPYDPEEWKSVDDSVHKTYDAAYKALSKGVKRMGVLAPKCKWRIWKCIEVTEVYYFDA